MLEITKFAASCFMTGKIATGCEDQTFLWEVFWWELRDGMIKGRNAEPYSFMRGFFSKQREYDLLCCEDEDFSWMGVGWGEMG